MKIPALFAVFVLCAVALGDPPHKPYAEQLTHRELAIAIRALESRVARLEARMNRQELRKVNP